MQHCCMQRVGLVSALYWMSCQQRQTLLVQKCLMEMTSFKQSLRESAFHALLRSLGQILVRYAQLKVSIQRFARSLILPVGICVFSHREVGMVCASSIIGTTVIGPLL